MRQWAQCLIINKINAFIIGCILSTQSIETKCNTNSSSSRCRVGNLKNWPYLFFFSFFLFFVKLICNYSNFLKTSLHFNSFFLKKIVLGDFFMNVLCCFYYLCLKGMSFDLWCVMISFFSMLIDVPLWILWCRGRWRSWQSKKAQKETTRGHI